MVRKLVTVWALAAALVGCQREPKPPANQPNDPLLVGLTPPPLNTPIHRPADAQDTTHVELAPGVPSTLQVLRNGAPFVGVANLSGRLSVSQSRIRLDQGVSRLELLYRLPAALPAPESATGDGSIAVVERSSPAGADRKVVARLGTRLILGELWQRSSTPLRVEVADGVRLVQQPVTTGSGSYAEAPLSVFEGDRLLSRVPLGRATEVQTRSGRYVVFAEVSHLFRPSAADLGQVEGGYILRAWIVPAK